MAPCDPPCDSPCPSPLASGPYWESCRREKRERKRFICQNTLDTSLCGWCKIYNDGSTRSESFRSSVRTDEVEVSVRTGSTDRTTSNVCADDSKNTQTLQSLARALEWEQHSDWGITWPKCGGKKESHLAPGRRTALNTKPSAYPGSLNCTLEHRDGDKIDS